jgi:phosphoglucosamine mutase
MAFELGRAAVELLGAQLVIGRDTRLSGSPLEDALVAGIVSAGGTPVRAGIIPTPAVALLLRELQADGGVVISASHNPPEYNGIKFFDRSGFKLSPELEDAFEARLVALAEEAGDKGTVLLLPHEETREPSPIVVPIVNPDDAAERYIAHAANTVRKQGLDLSGLTVAVDCGHGASWFTTPETLRRLGAEVVAINTDFNGLDINVGCGSTQLEPLRALVAQSGADAGIAHDGDADRVLAVDALGKEVDGDMIEAVCALDLQQRGKLAKGTVVSTVMCNLGFTRAMHEQGIQVVQTAVGDSNVLAAMREGGYVLGGEQSGHMIFLEHNSTGDGLVTALQLLAALKRSGKALSQLTGVMTRYPQVLINVRVADKSGYDSSAAIQDAVAAATERLGTEGRVLVRPSGTEALIRVMVEATSEPVARTTAETIAAVIERELK